MTKKHATHKAQGAILTIENATLAYGDRVLCAVFAFEDADGRHYVEDAGGDLDREGERARCGRCGRSLSPQGDDGTRHDVDADAALPWQPGTTRQRHQRATLGVFVASCRGGICRQPAV